MNSGASRPEWDTPPHGDFASYVERLTALPAERKAPPTTVRGTHVSSKLPSAVTSPLASQGLPPDLAQRLLPLMGGLRMARAVLLVFIVLHAIALFIFSQGSFTGLVFMGALWWGLGWLIQAASRALAATNFRAGSGTEPLQERLKQMAQKRHTGKKKSED